jgi:hypothetical protein
VGEPQNNGAIEEPGRVWEDIIKVDRREMVGGGPDRVSLARDRWRNVVSTVMNLQVLNFLTS